MGRPADAATAGLMPTWRRRAVRAGRRSGGEPASANGASSLHLIWQVPPLPYVAAAVTLEVLRLPTVDRLHFWALQVSFVGDGGHRGAAHLGLQWNPDFPGATAANWGGYARAEVGGLLAGSLSPLPSARDDANTRDYAWLAGHQYRLEVSRAPRPPTGTQAWRGTITDLAACRTSLVRDLFCDGEYLAAPMTWTEVFAPCECPGVAARWSDPALVAADGRVVRPTQLRVNYQRSDDGGCGNTTARTDDGGIVQETGVRRTTQQGSLLVLPG